MQSILKQHRGRAGLVAITMLLGSVAFGQNYVATPVGLYAPANAAATTIASGGNVLVSTGGNWFFAGNISSADKGGANAPTATGRAEVITFDGTGGLAANGFFINGYAATTAAQTASLVLPIGNATTAYPLTVPAGTAVAAAYFDGSGTQTTPVGGTGTNTTTEYSPYLDVPSGVPAGSYTLSYPTGFTVSGNSSILSSANTSAGGTSGTTAYSVLYNVPTPFSTSASTVVATLPATSATQVYFASSNVVLPVALVSFTGTASGCTANLAWQTATELNSSYYAVEASLGGSSFAQVGKVASKNSATGASYAYASALGSGTTYFRLKAVDNDGMFTYSPVVAVTGTGACSTGASVTVSPNPTRDVLNIQGLSTGSTVSVYGVNGQKMTSVIATGTNQRINIGLFAKGVYVLRILATDGSVSNVKVIKN